MHKFQILNYKRFSDLSLNELDKQNFSIYLIDFEWNYLFANTCAFKSHNQERSDLIGKNLWESLNEKMKVDTQFKVFIKNIQDGHVGNVTTISALSKKRVSVTGYPLEDCYYFAVTILPDKDDLMNELRNELKK
jgi:hypothetical protein